MNDFFRDIPSLETYYSPIVHAKWWKSPIVQELVGILFRLFEKRRSQNRKRNEERHHAAEVGVSFESKQHGRKSPGEDAYFHASCVSPRDKGNIHVMGIADGVGGWSQYGIDPREFSFNLMQNAEKHVCNGLKDPGQIIIKSYNDVISNDNIVGGGSTACVLSLDLKDRILHTANVGDSRYCIVRDEKMFLISEEQVFHFNCPVQLSKMPNGKRAPEWKVQRDSHQMREDDIIVLGTDGLFDNLFNEQILKIVNKYKNQGSIEIASQLTKSAKSAAKDKKPTPFSRQARKNAFRWIGGKDDDICVLVSRVS